MRAALLATVLLACATPEAPVDGATVAVHSWLEAASDGGGVLVVQTRFDPTGEVDLPIPEVEGLAFEPRGEPVLERLGDLDVWTQRYDYRGGKGMYRVPALEADWRRDAEQLQAQSDPLYIDIGVEPPREDEPADIVDPSRILQIPWALIAAGGGGLLVLLAGAAVAFGRGSTREAAVEVQEAPDVLAIRAWEAARTDPSLDDHGKALAIARIYREYTEVVLAFPATAWTTTEIVRHLTGMAHLPQGNVPRAKRLLRATDRVKFADHRPGGDLFDELDADLRGFIESTRPHNWQGGAP